MAESSNQAEQSALPRWLGVVVAVLTLPAFLLSLTVPFMGPDEPRYAEVGREMWQSGDWITPTLGGFHWFEKPPLLYWLEAVFYSVFGVNEFAARLGPALCGLAVVVCLWLLARIVLDRQFAGWIAIVGASTLGLIVFSHAATTDIVVTLPLTVAMSAFFIYDRRVTGETAVQPLQRYTPLIVMYVAAGVALLAKGLIGLIFPPATILFYYVLSRRLPPRQLLVSILWGIPLTLAVAATWYVPMYVRYGDELIQEFIVRQHFARFTTNLYQHPQPFYFYLWVLPLMTLPWLPFFLCGTWKGIRNAIKPAPTVASSSVLLFATSWMLVPLVFFSLSTSKLPGYILPALPPAIILAAMGVHSLAGRSAIWTRLSGGLAATALVVTIVLLVTIFPPRAAKESVKPLIDTVNARGYSSANILMLSDDNFSAEFYAAGRLPRTPEGKQAKLDTPSQIIDAIRQSGGSPTLVLTRKTRVRQLINDRDSVSEILADNGKDCIVLFTPK